MRRFILLLLILFPVRIFCQTHIISDSLVHKLTKNLEKIDTNNIDLTSVNDIKLDEIEVPLNDAIYSLESVTVNISDYKRYEIFKLQKKVNAYRRIINKQNSSLDLLFYNKGLEEITNKNYETGIKYFKKSIEVNPLYIPSLYKLSYILTEKGDLKQASELMTVLLNKTYPITTLNTQILNLANNIYDDFIKKADELKSKENYNSADEELLIAEQYCNSNSLINCNEKIEKEIVSTKYGLYKSFLSIAESAIDKKHYDMAENFIFSAIDYRKKNEKYIKDNKEAEKLAGAVTDCYINIATSYVNSHKYQKAMECFGKASALCDSIKDDECHMRVKKGISSIKNELYNELVTTAGEYMKKGKSDIAEDYLDKAKSFKNSNLKDISDSSFADIVLKKIKYGEYKRLIHDGKDFIKDDNYKYAFKSLNIADKLEKKYKLDNDREKDSLIKKAAKPVIIDKLKTSYFKIWDNEIEEAEKVIENGELRMENYYLKNDVELNYIINDLKQKVLIRKCGNYRDAYDLLLYKCDGLVQKLEYTEAIKVYNDAITLVNTHPECKLDAEEATGNITKYQVPAYYQVMTDEANSFYSKQDYLSFLSEYDGAEGYYSSFKIKDYGLKHIPMYDLILSKDDYRLMLPAIQFYIESNHPENALNLLKYLMNKKYDSEPTKGFQERLAIRLAKDDKNLNLKPNVKSQILSYTANSKWFKYFNKKYKEEMK